MNMEQFTRHPLVKRFNQFDTRRRVMIVGGWLVMLWVVLDSALVSPVGEKIIQINSELEGLEAQVTVEGLQKTKLLKQSKKEIVKTPEQELAELETRLAEVTLRLDRRTNSMVEPKQMVDLLREVFKHQTRVKLLDVESLLPEPIVTAIGQTDADVSKVEKSQKQSLKGKPEPQQIKEPDFYKHSVRLTFEGGYRDIARYLAKVENLRWQLYWGELSLTVKEFPTTRATVEVYTLSREKAWLGV